MNWSKLSPAEKSALVAERVMGWTRHPDKMHPTDNRTINGVLYCAPGFEGYNGGSSGQFNVVPPYSTSIADAMLVIEKMRSENGFSVGMWCATPISSAMWGWCVILKHSIHPPYLSGKEAEDEFTAHASTLPEAICLCSLRARKIQIEE